MSIKALPSHPSQQKPVLSQKEREIGRERVRKEGTERERGVAETERDRHKGRQRHRGDAGSTHRGRQT